MCSVNHVYVLKISIHISQSLHFFFLFLLSSVSHKEINPCRSRTTVIDDSSFWMNYLCQHLHINILSRFGRIKLWCQKHKTSFLVSLWLLFCVWNWLKSVFSNIFRNQILVWNTTNVTFCCTSKYAFRLPTFFIHTEWVTQSFNIG